MYNCEPTFISFLFYSENLDLKHTFFFSPLNQICKLLTFWTWPTAFSVIAPPQVIWLGKFWFWWSRSYQSNAALHCFPCNIPSGALRLTEARRTAQHSRELEPTYGKSSAYLLPFAMDPSTQPAKFPGLNTPRAPIPLTCSFYGSDSPRTHTHTPALWSSPPLPHQKHGLVETRSSQMLEALISETSPNPGPRLAPTCWTMTCSLWPSHPWALGAIEGGSSGLMVGTVTATVQPWLPGRSVDVQ